MTNTNITRDNNRRHILNIRQYNYRQRRIDRTRRMGYTLVLIQAFWDVKRCDDYQQMKYPLAVMIWSLSRLIEKTGGRFKLPPAGIHSATKNFWININNIEGALYQSLDYLNIADTSAIDTTPVIKDKMTRFNLVHVVRLLNEILVYVKELTSETGHDLEHLLYLAYEYGKEYNYFETEDRIKVLNSIRKKAKYGVKELHQLHVEQEVFGQDQPLVKTQPGTLWRSLTSQIVPNTIIGTTEQGVLIKQSVFDSLKEERKVECSKVELPVDVQKWKDENPFLTRVDDDILKEYLTKDKR
jgi:hypothetical protein